ncbi:hypothetical protein K450DRAFT_278250 [Umbelopsis ramanniana AG]|uniref:Late embryogenesis abundant protein LEA-2 subgroup domain-containing protein n=1 Tax=Umbelopsis ramanniana AG TaxID=1314678 RepID=A0AAD5HFL7_UMBRA|nr:uncharacterized protein K450DRAFT_278250 [Umbelopsis ramanniana AG]KAI8582572.1 hypothetical protein K450DRAFT_278250 [Umbelopsis ramanniana AG]
MSYLNKEGTSNATAHTADRSQAAEPTTINSDGSADGLANQKNESPTANDVLSTKEGNETKGKESSLPENNQHGHVKGVGPPVAVEERHENPAWEKYISSPEQQRAVSPTDAQKNDNLEDTPSNKIVYLSNDDLTLFTSFPETKIETHLFDIKPLAEEHSSAPPTQDHESETSTISKASIDADQENKNEDGFDREKGLFGKKGFFVQKRRWMCSSCTRSSIVIVLFGLIVCISITLAFIWPRLPLLQIQGASLVVGPTVTYNPSATTYMASWDLDIATDNRNNYVPVTAVVIDTFVRHSLTGTIFGRGQQSNVVLRPVSQYKMTLPIDINYQAKPDDAVMNQILASCGPGPKSNTTQPLEVDFGITIHIWGLSYFGYTPTITLTPPAGGFMCPFSAT